MSRARHRASAHASLSSKIHDDLVTPRCVTTTLDSAQILSGSTQEEYMTMARDKSAMTTKEVAARFHELAQQELWFEIQDELFADNVRSVEPPSATRLQTVQGKAAVRKKGED